MSANLLSLKEGLRYRKMNWIFLAKKLEEKELEAEERELGCAKKEKIFHDKKTRDEWMNSIYRDVHDEKERLALEREFFEAEKSNFIAQRELFDDEQARRQQEIRQIEQRMSEARVKSAARSSSRQERTGSRINRGDSRSMLNRVPSSGGSLTARSESAADNPHADRGRRQIFGDVPKCTTTTTSSSDMYSVRCHSGIENHDRPVRHDFPKEWPTSVFSTGAVGLLEGAESPLLGNQVADLQSSLALTNSEVFSPTRDFDHLELEQ
eukprot:GHVP01024258.1.p1 GENE.GHVP01024258.1~~GHVP01024258.1.p1  ORF type:complete len:266 (+),score=61.91 GHVP01024258.1:842-1639(+)